MRVWGNFKSIWKFITQNKLELRVKKLWRLYGGIHRIFGNLLFRVRGKKGKGRNSCITAIHMDQLNHRPEVIRI